MRRFIKGFTDGFNLGVVSIGLFVMTLVVLDLSVGHPYNHTIISLIEKLGTTLK